MSWGPRLGRRPDDWSSPHERARTRAAERLDAALTTDEDAWLETHLADCAACRAIGEAYLGDRLALRELRQAAPAAPRDLWARTAARIEHESAGRSRPAQLPGSQRTRSLPALGALSGLAVVAVVVIATAVSGGFLGRVGTVEPASSPSPVALASPEGGPAPTAIAVGAGQVQWFGAGADGAFAYHVAEIDAVCPLDRQPDCAPFADLHARRVTLAASPRFIYQSPVENQAVVVGTDAVGSDAVLVVVLPTPDSTPDALSLPAEPLATAASATPGATDPTASTDPPSPTAPTVTPVAVPSETALASQPAPDEPTPSELIGPEPSPVAVAIITDVIVVGRSAAYSPDGGWFAFSARPADGSVGPDIYVWQVGDLLARPLTADHASVFASWVGGRILGSRVRPEPPTEPVAGLPYGPSPEIPPAIDEPPSPGASSFADATAPAEIVPETFLLDPSTGAEISLGEAEWQPVVDPTGRAVVAWQGTVRLAADGLTTVPANGSLVIHRFHGPLDAEEPFGSPTASPDPAFSAMPEPTADPAASPSEQAALDFPSQVIQAGPIADFDARWDDTGTWLAIWIADPLDPAVGRLSLLHFDQVTGLVDRPEGAPQDVTALPGFSIGEGRLAWATPPGQEGEGSRIQIVAWTPDQVGAIESVPVEGAIVVQ